MKHLLVMRLMTCKPTRNDDSDKNDSENLSGSVPKTGKKSDTNSKPGLQGA